VDPVAVELGAEVGERVQPTLLRAPVELVGPVGKQPTEVVEVGALAPGITRCRVGPARVADPRLHIGEDVVLDANRERLDPYRRTPHG
jgi:hypothetical protein